MSKVIKHEILKYLDFFGTSFTFYIEKQRKLYTTFFVKLSDTPAPDFEVFQFELSDKDDNDEHLENI